VLKQGDGPSGLCRIFDLLNGNQPGNMKIAKELFEQAQKLSFE
jgi:ABC-type arginine transport system ATPase subunit